MAAVPVARVEMQPGGSVDLQAGGTLQLAAGLDGISLDADRVDSNIVIFDVAGWIS